VLSQHVSLNAHLGTAGVVAVRTQVLLWRFELVLVRFLRLLLLLIQRELHHQFLIRFTLTAVSLFPVLLMLLMMLRLVPVCKRMLNSRSVTGTATFPKHITNGTAKNCITSNRAEVPTFVQKKKCRQHLRQFAKVVCPRCNVFKGYNQGK
jgi:hypothetical protein